MHAMQQIKTRIFVISDTHGEKCSIPETISDHIDVLIHCGDLTEGSKLAEFHTTLQLLKDIKAPLKLVIAGNHDFTLDSPMFKKKIAEVKPSLEPELVTKEYGFYGQIRQLFEEAESDGIMLLDEGNHHFELANGASLQIYASSYTPSTSDWGFEYRPDEDHEWHIGEGTDIVITHGPPRGIFDMSDSKRIGSPSLFTAVAKARPRMHCFGHVHSGWGAKLSSWRSRAAMNEINHFTAIDNHNSATVETLAGLIKKKYDTPEIAQMKADKLRSHLDRGYVSTNHVGDPGSRTLFVNAAIKGSSDELPVQLPWMVELSLPMTRDTDTRRAR
ncbi:Metallo-dependent phosphatase [Myriangium duriaei CBS 260.36]|uniref:Metallo-dependent phosphatase n=1 Tax=Myriangium duriaei CBS 260.36 TaxID=1168546 RepID=A0A9P4MCF3_9PEZI|nr:Metallo-dependent phosphatase [Myriangium duriaei CBS 260.36]